MKKILPWIILTAFITTLLGMTGGYFLRTTVQNYLPQKHFFSDDIVIFSPDVDGVPFLLQLELNRKQTVTNTYVHYDFIDLLWKNININEYNQFENPESTITPQQELRSFHNTQASDLSTRETYNFQLELGGKNLQVAINNLEGDFIVRNMLDYTKYVSIGDAEVTLDGRTFQMEAAVSKTYAPDFSHYLFFDGYEQLRSVTDYLVLWDEAKNFYMIDTTKTASEDYNYKSHTWILTKEKATNTMRKAFSADVQRDEFGNIIITIPDLARTIKLRSLVMFDEKASEGIGGGIITTPSGNAPIGGSMKHIVY